MDRMADRDPFGRLPDENPLAGLGGSSDGTVSQSTAAPVISQPSGSVAAPAAIARSREPQRPQPSPLSGVNPMQAVRLVQRGVRLFVLLIVIGVFAGVAGPVIDAVNSVKDQISSSTKDISDAAKSNNNAAAPGDARSGSGSDGDTSNAPAKDAPLPSGLNATSLLREHNLKPAIAHLAKSGLGHLTTMSIRPDRIDPQLVTNGGSLRSADLTYTGQLRDFGTSAAGLHFQTIPFGRIDTAAPARLARSAAGRSKQPVSHVGYVVIQSFAGKVQWNAYMKDGKIFEANAHGRITRRIS
jgi:hypothetical protein